MIGIIGGGNMGEALIRGLLKNNRNLIICEISPQRIDYLKNNYEIDVTENLNELLKNSEIVIFAVKPQVIDSVLENVKNSKISLDEKLFISIAAGVKIEKFEKYLGSDKKIIRVMPNACAFVLESMSALSPNKNVTEEDITAALEIFNSIGESVVIDEVYMDAITGLSGSGPGFIALILEAFSDAGVNVGLPRNIVDKLILQTFKGTIKLIEEGKSYIEVKNMVTSPGGTTIAGIHELEKGRLKATIMNCIKRATERSRELG